MMSIPKSTAADPVVVDRRLLVSYDNYAAAQRAVDALSDAGFPVEHAAIVGSDLRLEETVTGRLTKGRAALTGAASGAVFGLVVGLFLGLFTTTTTSFFALVLWSLLWGAVLGAAFGFTSHAFKGGTRDFTSRSAIVAGRYDVLVAGSYIDHARAVLEGGAQPADTVVVDRPPSAGTLNRDGVAAPASSPAAAPSTGPATGPASGPYPASDPATGPHPTLPANPAPHGAPGAAGDGTPDSAGNVSDDVAGANRRRDSERTRP